MSSAPRGDRPEATYAEMETFLDETIVEHSVPGASVAVTDRDGILHSVGIGARDLESGEPATPETLYSFGSFTKVVTALLRCLLNGGELEGTRVLETIDDRREGCGYGPQLSEFLGERAVWHTGTSPDAGRAFGGILPDRGLGVAVGANAPEIPMEAVGKGVLAIAAGEDPVEVVPHLALRRKVHAVAGTYEGFRGGVTVTVEPADDDTHVEVTYEDGPGWTFPAFPESVAHDDYSFYRIREGGLRASVDFHETDDGMELRSNVDRLERTNASE